MSRDDCDGAPAAKRLKSNLDLYNTNLDDSLARMCHSQPPPSFADNDNQDPVNVEARNDYCFSQPADLSDLLICTQLTQGSTQIGSNPFQKLVKRMTRFFVTTKCDETIKQLTTVLDKFGWNWKLNDDSTVTISTLDRRKLQLTFKANIIDMDGKLLLDFRLSKGCGLEFKKKFVLIRQAKEIAEIVLNIPINFSLATSVA
jgi:serine/threonine-protein kinase CHEK1